MFLSSTLQGGEGRREGEEERRGGRREGRRKERREGGRIGCQSLVGWGGGGGGVLSLAAALYISGVRGRGASVAV